jgi:hypothetical protein
MYPVNRKMSGMAMMAKIASADTAAVYRLTTLPPCITNEEEIASIGTVWRSRAVYFDH